MTNLPQHIPRFVPPAHNIYVCRLYKRALRLCGDWYWEKDEYRENAFKIRCLFEQHRHEENPKAIEELLKDAEWQLAKYYHPIPYRAPTAPGGSKWERNLPVPEEHIKRGVSVHEDYF